MAEAIQPTWANHAAKQLGPDETNKAFKFEFTRQEVGPFKIFKISNEETSPRGQSTDAKETTWGITTKQGPERDSPAGEDPKCPAKTHRKLDTQQIVQKTQTSPVKHHNF